MLRAVQERLWRAEPFAAFCEHLTRRVHELRLLAGQTAEAEAQEAQRVDREIGRLVQALKDGVPAMAVRDELLALERRKAALQAPRGPVPNAALPLPEMGQLYRAKVQGLREALSSPESRTQAADLLRGFVEEIRLTPTETGQMEIAVRGNLAGVAETVGLPLLANGVGCGGGI